MSNKPAYKQNQPTISEKQESQKKSQVDPGFSLDPMSLDAELAKEIESKGFVGRFISVKQLERNGGRHNKGWRPYKRDKISTELSGIFGRDPDNYVRRGDLILAVKTQEEVNSHKAYLRQEADASSVNNSIKRQKEQLKQAIRSNGKSESMYVESDN